MYTHCVTFEIFESRLLRFLRCFCRSFFSMSLLAAPNIDARFWTKLHLLSQLKCKMLRHVDSATFTHRAKVSACRLHSFYDAFKTFLRQIIVICTQSLYALVTLSKKVFSDFLFKLNSLKAAAAALRQPAQPSCPTLCCERGGLRQLLLKAWPLTLVSWHKTWPRRESLRLAGRCTVRGRG